MNQLERTREALAALKEAADGGQWPFDESEEWKHPALEEARKVLAEPPTTEYIRTTTRRPLRIKKRTLWKLVTVVVDVVIVGYLAGILLVMGFLDQLTRAGIGG